MEKKKIVWKTFEKHMVPVMCLICTRDHVILMIDLWDCVRIKSIHFVICNEGLEGLLETRVCHGGRRVGRLYRLPGHVKKYFRFLIFKIIVSAYSFISKLQTENKTK